MYTKQGSYFVGDEVEFVFEPKIGYELRTLRINNENVNLDLDSNYTIDQKTNISSYKTNMVEFGFFVEVEFKESSNLIIKEPTEIVFWTNKGIRETNWFKEKIATLKLIEPNLEIQLEQVNTGVNDYISQINDKLDSVLAPNLVTLPSKSVYPFELQNLNDFILHPKYGVSQEDYDDIKTSTLINSALYENKTQGILIDNSYYRMFYNKTAVDQLVQNVPELEMLDESTIGNISMEDFLLKICPIIKEYNESLSPENKLYDDSQEYSAILSVDFKLNFFEELALKTGGYVKYDEKGNRKFLFNNKFFMEKLTLYKRAIDLGYINKFCPYYTNYDFLKKKSLFGLNPSSGAKYYLDKNFTFTTSVTNVPYTCFANETKYGTGNQFSILSNASNEKKLGAWVALKYFTNYENSLEYGINNYSYLPRKSQKNDEVYKEFINQNINSENDLSAPIFAKVMRDMNEDETIQAIISTADNSSLNDGTKIEDFFKWFSDTNFTEEQLETKLTELENSLGN